MSLILLLFRFFQRANENNQTPHTNTIVQNWGLNQFKIFVSVVVLEWTNIDELFTR